MILGLMSGVRGCGLSGEADGEVGTVLSLSIQCTPWEHHPNPNSI